MKTSLRTRLIVVSSAFVMLIWLLAIVIVAVNLRWFLDRLIDMELERDMRLSMHLYQIIAPNPTADLAAVRAISTDTELSSGLQGEWGFRIYFNDGRAMFGTANTPELRLPDTEGFHDMDLEGDVWRVYAKPLEESYWMVLVANKSGANAIILDNLSPALWFLLLVLPFTIIAVVYGIHRTTQPIVELEQRMRDRSPRSLDPLDSSDVPAEIEPLIDAINKLLGRVSKLVSHEHRFVANAAHELQTPLAAIKTELENARQLAPDSDLAQILSRLEQRVNRSVHSVKQLLTLARLDPDIPLERADQVNLEHILYDELAAQGDEILRLNLNCNVQCQASLLEACNGELITILVRNLIENAIKYAITGTEVDIHIFANADEVRLQIANDCPPLSPDTLQHLRDSFFRVPGNDATGAGLGLAIVDRVAELHGGTLDFQYRRGQSGLQITVIFPVKR